MADLKSFNDNIKKVNAVTLMEKNICSRYSHC